MTAHELSESADQIQPFLAEAHAQRRRGEYDEAITLCTRVLRHDPENPDALALLGDIYRELGNYREALGWYQLAVQHSPDRPAMQRRLDEMIERVFPGTGGGAPLPLAPSGRPARRPGASRDGLVRLLARLQPIHVVIAFAVLAMLGMGIVMIAGAGRSAAPPPRPTPPATETSETGSAVVMPPSTNPPVMTPPPDRVEANEETEPAPRPRPAPTPTPPATTPVTPPGAITPPATEMAAPPAAPALSSEALEQQTQQLKTVLDAVSTTAKLQITVTAVLLDPRTGDLRIDYTIPRMVNPAETKKGLLYAGFQLIWASLRVSTHPRTFTLRGSAYLADNRAVTTALLADVTWQQMEGARSVTDYTTIQRYLTNPWWRDDLTDVAL
ncbi:MAG TPA: tetratricopeptide repeat protein [Armatimonadota bacterium]|nr:tetratricopeptide repeat protein [Armatimonadota bacterium]